MNSPLLSKLDRKNALDVLSILKNYRNSLKQIGKRARLIDPHQKQAMKIRIHHIPSLSSKDTWKSVESVVQ